MTSEILAKTSRATLLAALLAIPAPALAELPDGVRAMIDAAIATGDKAKVETVIALAKETQPDSAAEIEAIATAWRADMAEAAQLAAAQQEQEIRQAGLFDRWTGEGQLGAFQSTGNAENVGVSAALKLAREGIDWTHKLNAQVDFQRANGVTNREQFLVSYEPRYQIDEGLFAFGLAQWERDRFQGFSSRWVASGGIGYTVLDTDNAKLSIKAGPAFRVTEFTDGTQISNLAGLIGADFDWKISDRITFTQDANATAETGGEALVIIDGANTSINLITGLDFKVSDSLRSRLSYQIEYDSNPPIGAESTDTLTRFTLVYGF